MALRIDRSDVGVLVIDVQPLFLDWAFPDGGDRLESFMVRIEHLLMLAGWMDLPTLTTFEIPTEENGELPDRLEKVFPSAGQRFEKDYFGCISNPPIREAVDALGVRQIAVAGAETDVCVLQTTLGLLDAGYEVFLLEDCLSTTESQPGPAIRRMYGAGAVPCTLKTMAYELAACVTDTPWYPDGWAKGHHPDARPFPQGFTQPEAWPSWESKI